ncbi:pilus (MSHA type) biogenesis protein MshL [Rhizobacter sp. SG703]|uniref:pilus (MSHA type) biogenesis protein MshL n=1 Tax=Rhizobacter sp. SG703 TaxID=2587140 RepID=UPI0014480191|nr:pilus (MSHA type) biogenesis protein MshL [Rhizobacter sp. SG703]NKI92765.1 MSHA biogenesis protein MshL [Rhizobacter sp. SG703]
MNPIQAVRRPGRPGLRWMSSLCAAPLLTLGLALGLYGCADQPLRTASPNAHLQAELAAALAQRPPSAPVSTPDTPPPAPKLAMPVPPSEARFDLIVNGAQVRDVFLSLVTDSRYSMLMHPDVGGTISVTLKGVTMREALESLREVYGYDYKIDGRRVTVFPPTLQTRIFMVNYLHTQRSGRSDTRISSGASSGGDSSSNGSTGANGGTASNGGRSRGSDTEGSQVSTSSKSDFWAETTEALRAMVGTAAGRNVIASPQSGTIAVRAMPDELRQVDAFLRSTRASVERQVMLEAKIIEVELRDGFQNGIDWSVLRSRFAIGQSSGSAGNALVGNANGLPTLASGASALADAVGLPVSGSGATGLAIASGGFQSILGFIETHGDVQILSSPRVATLNNQKAVLKVGTDDYFVTNVSGGSITTGSSTSTGTTTLPTLTLTAFFSGIALDVTPQIDEAGMVTLHVHPSVTSVVEKTKQIDLGTIGNYRLPLASSSVNETDTVVRIPDGAIVAIGGLMQMESSRQSSGLPGASSNALTGTLFSNRVNAGRKRELVVLIKPTIIRGPDDWQRLTEQSRASLDEIEGQRRVITLDGSAKKPAVR